MSQTVFLVKNTTLCAAFSYSYTLQIYFREYSLFYEGRKTAEIFPLVDIFKRESNTALLPHISGEEQDQGPCVTVNRSKS